ncbi:MAG: hypothetical protein IJ338_10800 [Bacteroidaceae bacterium]|nr:hypothetical protein [Bacteroidaceae bacterium]
MKSRLFICLVIFLSIVITACQKHSPRNYVFNSNGISREVLENYLSRSVTLTEFLIENPYYNNAPLSDKEDDIRMLRNLKAKFIGRAIYRWGREHFMADTTFLNPAKRLINRMHEYDTEMIFQAAVFEIVTSLVDSVEIPEWTFSALGIPYEKRRFKYENMLNENGKFVNHWGNGASVPDITRQEAQLWLMFMAGSYIQIGCEAIHWGQVNLIGMNDHEFRIWAQFLDKARIFAQQNSRRGWVLFDAHTPTGGMIVDGKSLLDFNSFPLRIKEIPEKPMQGVLQKNYLDALYGKSKGGITPSGWHCESIPYLVEFDNFGISRQPGAADTASHFIWGYDEISWFCKLDEKYRDYWLHYASEWVQQNDKNAFLQMPLSRVVTWGKGHPQFLCKGNNHSEACPNGMNIEKSIADIWSKQP